MPTYRKSLLVNPPGEYEVKVMSAEEKESKNKNEMIILKLCVEGSPHWFSDHLVFTESSAWKIAQFLTAMGEEATDDKEIHGADYVGRSARAVAGVEEFNGRPRNTIDRWLPPAASSPAIAELNTSAAVTTAEIG